MLKATVLVDNIAGEVNGEPLTPEWGLSFYIEYGEKVYLLDMGQSELFAENAKLLGIDLSKVDAAVLSHAHVDHAGGIRRFFAENSRALFWVQEGTKEDCWARLKIFPKYMGIPKHTFRDFPDRIAFAAKKQQLDEGVWLLGHSTPGLEALGKKEHMYRRQGWRLKPDDYAHEQSLIFETDEGLVIFNSCCHGGTENIIRETREAFPGKNIRALIGGFHLYPRKDDEVRTVAEKLQGLGVCYVCTGHCTGGRAYGLLADTLGGTLHQLHCGLVMEF